MAVLVLDLRKKRERTTFVGTSRDEIRYAEAFWQSVRLQPTMESRLVSSDIKQRLNKRAASSKSGASTEHCTSGSGDKKLNELFVRARTLDQIERFEHLRKLAEARIEDRNRLHKRREERIRKEQISRDKCLKSATFEELINVKTLARRRLGEAYSIEEMIHNIAEFEKRKYEECCAAQGASEEVAAPAKARHGRSESPEVVVNVLPLET